MHLVGADLHFHNLALRPDHRCVQGLVTVFLGVGYVIIEFVRNMAPQSVDNTQGGVTVAHFRNKNTHGANIVDLGEIDALAPHFPPDAVDVLGAAGQLSFNAIDFQFGLQSRNDALDVAITVQALLVEQLGDLFVGGFMQVAEGQVLQLPFYMTDTKTMGQRRIDIEHFPGHTHSLFFRSVLDGPNGAGPLGQFDQGNPDVVNHGDEHLADVVQLPLTLPEDVPFQRVMDG